MRIDLSGTILRNEEFYHESWDVFTLTKRPTYLTCWKQYKRAISCIQLRFALLLVWPISDKMLISFEWSFQISKLLYGTNSSWLDIYFDNGLFSNINWNNNLKLLHPCDSMASWKILKDNIKWLLRREGEIWRWESTGLVGLGDKKHSDCILVGLLKESETIILGI